MLKKNVKSDLEDREIYEDGLITDEPVSETTAVLASPHQHMLDFSDHEPMSQFIERPIIRSDGAYQPIQYRTTGHLLSSGIYPENIQAGSLLLAIMLSPRWGYQVSAMLEPDDPQGAAHLINSCLPLVPDDATIEFPELKPEHLYINGGQRLDGKCIISLAPNGFSKVTRDLDLILTRGYAVRQDVAKGRYEIDLSEHRTKMKVSVVGIDGEKPGKGLTLPSILKIPVRYKSLATECMKSDIIEQYDLIQSPVFKIRKSLQRLKPQPVIIPYEGQLSRAIDESGCEHPHEKMGILKNVISVCAIINRPPSVQKAELGSIMYGTDEQEVSRWLIEAGLEQASEVIPKEPIVATKVDYHMARLLLDGLLMTGPTRFSDRQKKVFETVKAINMGKMRDAILRKNDDVEKLATISRSSGYWASREKIFEIINNGSYDFSLSSVSNDLVALLEMGVLERAKPPKSRFFGYYIMTTTLSDAIQLPASETIQDPVYEGKSVKVVNPFTGEVEEI